MNSPTQRRSPAEVAALDAAIVAAMTAAQPPLTVRQVYYLAVAQGIVPKSHQHGYRVVQIRLTALRETGEVPYEWIIDNSRQVSEPLTYASVEDAVAQTARWYRRDHWADQPVRVEVWCESDSIATFISPTTRTLGVPLLPAKGQTSRSFAYTAAQAAIAADKPVRIVYLGDRDPSGLSIPDNIEVRYAEHGVWDVELERVAVTPEQAASLPGGGEPKRSDPNYARFAADCEAHGLPIETFETEAIDPRDLRVLVDSAVRQHIDEEAWAASGAAEKADRAQLKKWAARA